MIPQGEKLMSEILKSLSDALAANTEAVSPSVVRMETRRRMPATGVVWNSDGVIVTSNHVVERDDNLRVGLPDGSTVEGKLVGRDPSTDLAVLKVENASLSVPHWADVSEIKVGHLVLAVGRPGKQVMATLGVVSAFDTAEKMRIGGALDYYLQTDVVMYPGFSGGPLMNASGHVLGINTSALLDGVSLTITATTIKRVVETLLKHGKMRRGFLGVGAQGVKLPAVLAEALKQEVGLLIMVVEPGSPAEKGGLFMGDTIVQIDGRALRSPDELVNALTGDLIGRTVTLRVLRGGQLQNIEVVVGERG